MNNYQNIWKFIPGIMFCFLLGSILFISTKNISYIFLDPLLISLILGILYKNLRPNDLFFESGSKFIAKHILEFSVMLLGSTINSFTLFNSNLSLMYLVIIGVFGSMIIAYIVGHMIFKLDTKISTLIGVGNGICGNSAIAVMAPIIGATSTQIGSVIGISAILGATQILLFPIVYNIFNLSESHYGILVGMSVYAVAQVYAASAIISLSAASVATVVKISRVVLLGPLVLLIQIIKATFFLTSQYKESESNIKFSIFNYLPWFVIGFFILSILNSIGIITSEVSDLADDISKYLFITSMISIGLSVYIKDLFKVGYRVGITIFSVITFMVLISLIFGKIYFN